MPRAGWCRDCEEWVWVGESGECQHGHSGKSVSHVYEADPKPPFQSPAAPGKDPVHELDKPFAPASTESPVAEFAEPFGVGTMPPRLQRFNWGAFMLPAVWGLVYRVWSIVALWFVATFAPLFLGIIFGITQANGTVSIPALIGVTVVSDAVLAYVRLWTGGSANRLYWERETLRLGTTSGATPKFDAQRYLERQRLWVPWGILALTAGIILTLVTNYGATKSYGFGPAFVAEPIIFIFAQVGFGFWLSRRMAEEYPDVPGSAPSEGIDPPATTPADGEG